MASTIWVKGVGRLIVQESRREILARARECRSAIIDGDDDVGKSLLDWRRHAASSRHETLHDRTAVDARFDNFQIIDIADAASQVGGLSRCVHTIIADARVRLVGTGDDGLRKAALECENRTELPSSQHVPNQSILLLEEWQRVNIAARENMPSVEI